MYAQALALALALVLALAQRTNTRAQRARASAPAQIRIHTSRPSFDQVADEAFSQIIATAADAHVLRHTAAVLTTFIEQTTAPRRTTLQHHLDTTITRQRSLAETE